MEQPGEQRQARDTTRETYPQRDWWTSGIGTIPCKVGPGLFPDERSVVIQLEGGTAVAFVLERDVLTEEEATGDRQVGGRLVVNIVRELEDGVIVRLPADTLNSGSRIKVRKEVISNL